jgi:hypothetical protein
LEHDALSIEFDYHGLGRTMATLIAFKVTNFRNIHDSGWIEAGRVTALIGQNESGKRLRSPF